MTVGGRDQDGLGGWEWSTGMKMRSGDENGG